MRDAWCVVRGSLVPRLCLGTHCREALPCLPRPTTGYRGVLRGSEAEPRDVRSQAEPEGVSEFGSPNNEGLQRLSFFCHKETNTAGDPKNGTTCQGGHGFAGL